MAYPSNCKPIPLDAIQQMIEKVFYEDSSASRRTDSWSLRDTFEDDIRGGPNFSLDGDCLDHDSLDHDSLDHDFLFRGFTSEKESERSSY
jgi:hypothetical protein